MLLFFLIKQMYSRKRMFQPLNIDFSPHSKSRQWKELQCKCEYPRVKMLLTSRLRKFYGGKVTMFISSPKDISFTRCKIKLANYTCQAIFVSLVAVHLLSVTSHVYRSSLLLKILILFAFVWNRNTQWGWCVVKKFSFYFVLLCFYDISQVWAIQRLF